MGIADRAIGRYLQSFSGGLLAERGALSVAHGAQIEAQIGRAGVVRKAEGAGVVLESACPLIH